MELVRFFQYMSWENLHLMKIVNHLQNFMLEFITLIICLDRKCSFLRFLYIDFSIRKLTHLFLQIHLFDCPLITEGALKFSNIQCLKCRYPSNLQNILVLL